MSIFVKKSVEVERMNVCRACPVYQESSRSCGPLLNKLMPHPVEQTMEVNGEVIIFKPCGCRLDLKTKFPFTSCPAGKWGPFAITKAQQYELKEWLIKVKGTTGDQYTGIDITTLARWKSLATGMRITPTTCEPCVKQDIDDMWNMVKDITEPVKAEPIKPRKPGPMKKENKK